MNVSERFYKVGSIFDVTVGKFDAKTLKRDRSDVTVETKNRKKLDRVQNSIEPTLTTLEPWLYLHPRTGVRIQTTVERNSIINMRTHCPSYI